MKLNPFYLRTRFWIKDYFNGSPIRKAYREIKYLSETEESKASDYRNKQLKDLFAHARAYSKFYAQYKTDSLKDYPVMNKALLIENAEQIRVPDERIPGQKGNVFIQKTSGSTGTPLAVPQDTMKRQRRIADLKYFGQLVGYKSHEPLIHLRIWNKWQTKTQQQIKKENIYPFDCSNLSEDKLKDLCELINKTNAVSMRAYASCFDLLAKYVKNHPQNKFPSLKVLFSISEMLYDDTRAAVKKYLGCEIISQYADEECGILANELPPTSDTDNIMYLNHADYFFEFLKLDSDEPAEYGEIARIVITDLHNYAFPMIRYDCGDTGILMPPNDKSHGYPILGKLFGRRMDMVYTTQGEPFSPMLLARTVKHFDKIKQWQFAQTGEKKYELRLILTECEDANLYMEQAIITLKEIVGEDANIAILPVEKIPEMKSGKRKTVVNEWKR